MIRVNSSLHTKQRGVGRTSCGFDVNLRTQLSTRVFRTRPLSLSISRQGSDALCRRLGNTVLLIILIILLGRGPFVPLWRPTDGVMAYRREAETRTMHVTCCPLLRLGCMPGPCSVRCIPHPGYHPKVQYIRMTNVNTRRHPLRLSLVGTATHSHGMDGRLQPAQSLRRSSRTVAKRNI